MGTTHPTAAGDRYVAVYDSARFKVLRRRSNTFIASVAAAFYGWWLLVILLAAFVPQFFRIGLGGPMNVGLLVVGLSSGLVVVVSAVCVRYAAARLDPLGDEIRADLERELR